MSLKNKKLTLKKYQESCRMFFGTTIIIPFVKIINYLCPCLNEYLSQEKKPILPKSISNERRLSTLAIPGMGKVNSVKD